MIEFLNPSMFPCLLAIVIPVIIHFFIRAKARSLPFAAIFLLKQTIGKRNSRIRFSQMLLLLLRMAMVVCLGLAMLQPVFKTGDGPVSAEGKNVVFLIDNSFSLHLGEGDKTQFRSAVQLFEAVFDQLDSRDRFCVLTTQEPVEIKGTPFDFATQKAKRKIVTQLECGWGRGNLLEAYLRAQNLLSRLPNRQKAIVVVSDFQKGDTQPLEAYLKGNETSIATLLIPTGNPDMEVPKNLYFGKVEVPFVSYLGQEKVPLMVHLRGSGGAFLDGTLEVYLGDTLKYDFPVRLSTGAEIAKKVFLPREVEQQLAVKVSLSDDRFGGDNTYYLFYEGPVEIKVLLVLSSDATDHFFVEAAMDPFLHRGLKGKTAFTLKKAASLSQAGNLGAFDLVVLCNPESLEFEDLEPLNAFAREGGGVLFTFGQNTGMDAVNRFFDGFTKDTLWVGELESREEASSPETQALALTPFGEELFSFLLEGELIQTARINQVIKLVKETSAPSMQVCIENQAGDPVWVTKDLERGRVGWIMTPLTPEGTSMVGEPLFLPLMHQFGSYLSEGKRQKRSYIVGEKVPLGAVKENEKWVCLDPQGEKVAFQISENKEAFIKVQSPGVYRVFSGKEIITQFAVNVPPRESAFEYIDMRGSDIGKNRVFVGSESATIEKFMDRGKGNILLWRFLFWIFFLFLIVEILIVWRLRP